MQLFNDTSKNSTSPLYLVKNEWSLSTFGKNSWLHSSDAYTALLGRS